MTEKAFPIRQIPFGTHIENTSHAAFVCIYARDCQPYDVHNPEIPDGIRYLKTHRILLYGRHDDTTGWPGGGSEDKDFKDAPDFISGLKATVIREAKQEIGHDLKAGNLEPICSHYYAAGKATHLFGYETDYETLLKIAGHVASMKKYFAESTGIVLSTTLLWPKPGATGGIDPGRGIFSRFQQPSPPAFREELYQALSHLRLTGIDTLREIERRFLPPAYLQSPAHFSRVGGLKPGDCKPG